MIRVDFKQAKDWDEEGQDTLRSAEETIARATRNGSVRTEAQKQFWRRLRRESIIFAGVVMENVRR